MYGVKSTVLKAFYDMHDPAQTIYQVGSTFEGSAERVADLEERGFVEAEKPAENPAPKKRTTRKKAADA